MRATVMALAAVFGLMALPAPVQAAPAVLHDLALGAPAFELVRDGCGRGWHRETRSDRWGNRRSRCVPNRW